MTITKKGVFLASLVALVTVGLVFVAVQPGKVLAQSGSCSLDFAYHPVSATVGEETSEPYVLNIKCGSGSGSNQISAPVLVVDNKSDKERIFGPEQIQDEETAIYHTFSKAGDKKIVAEISYIEREYDPRGSWTTHHYYDKDSVVTSVESSLSPVEPPSNVSIDSFSGPSNVSLGATERYRATFRSSDSFEYRFKGYQRNYQDSGWRKATGALVDGSYYYDFTFTEAGTNQICVAARAGSSGSADEVKCMPVEVEGRTDPNLDAEFISQSVPTSVETNETFSVSITMRNTGTDPWTQSRKFRLGSQNPHDNRIWGTQRIHLPTNSVSPGEEVTFSLNAKAPKKDGQYNFRWRMVEEHVQWFGERTNNVVIEVGEGGPPPEDNGDDSDDGDNGDNGETDSENQAVLHVSSQGATNVPINHVHDYEGKLGPDDNSITNYTLRRDNDVGDTWITAPKTHQGLSASHWEGDCSRDVVTGGGDRGCEITDFNRGDTKSVTIIYAEADNSPSANAGNDHNTPINETYTHSGANAIDQDGDLNSYSFSWVGCEDYDGSSFSCPPLSDSSGNISGDQTNISGPTYTPAQAGHYTFELTVTDQRGNQDTNRATGTTPACADGTDNDGDGLIDYGDGETNDPDCESPEDDQEEASSFKFDIFRFFER